MGLFRKSIAKAAELVALALEAPFSPAVQWAIGSLRDAPDEWTFSTYRATHVGGAWVKAHLDWTTTLAIPGIGEVLREADVGGATPAHKALLQAAFDAQRIREGDLIGEYVAATAQGREDKARKNAEAARRNRWTAEGLRLEADKLDRQAASLLPQQEA